MSLVRHVQLHLPNRMRRAAEVAKESPASPKTLEQVDEHQKISRAVFSRAYHENNFSAQIGALAEWRKGIELKARLRGQLNEGSTTNVLNVSLSPDQAAGMAEILLQRHRARLIETTAEVKASEPPAMAQEGSDDSEEAE